MAKQVKIFLRTEWVRWYFINCKMRWGIVYYILTSCIGKFTYILLPRTNYIEWQISLMACTIKSKLASDSFATILPNPPPSMLTPWPSFSGCFLAVRSFLARRCPWTHHLQASTWWINDLHSHPPRHTLPGPANWELPEDRDGTPQPSPKSPMSSSLKFMTYLVFGLGEKEHLGREFFAEDCLEGIRWHFCMLGFASNHHRCHPREPQQHFIPLAVISKDEKTWHHSILPSGSTTALLTLDYN